MENTEEILICALFSFSAGKQCPGKQGVTQVWGTDGRSLPTAPEVARLPRLVPQQWIPLPGIPSLSITQDEWNKADNLAWRCCSCEQIVQNKNIQKTQTSQSSLTLDFPFPMLNPLIQIFWTWLKEGLNSADTDCYQFIQSLHGWDFKKILWGGPEQNLIFFV